MTGDREVQISLSKADLFQFLAISLHLPTMDYIHGLLDGSIAKDVIDILSEMEYPAEQVGKISQNLKSIQERKITAEDLFSEMRQEYTHLFTNPVKPAVGIYETIFLFNGDESDKKPSMFISPAALSAERYYKKAGLHTTGDSQEPADYFPTELEYMMFLYQQLAKSVNENDLENQEKWQTLIDEFSLMHLKKWAGKFFATCKTASTNQVYTLIGTLGKMCMDRMLI